MYLEHFKLAELIEHARARCNTDFMEALSFGDLGEPVSITNKVSELPVAESTPQSTLENRQCGLTNRIVT